MSKAQQPIQKELLLYLLLAQAEGIAAEIGVGNSLKKSIRSMKSYVEKEDDKLNQTKVGGVISEVANFNFTRIVEGITNEVIFTDKGEIKIVI